MDNLKTKFLLLSLVIVLFLSVYAITAAESDGLINDTQDLKLSEDTIADGVKLSEDTIADGVKLSEDLSDDAALSEADTDAPDDIADEKSANTKNKLGVGSSKITVIFHKMSSDGGSDWQYQ